MKRIAIIALFSAGALGIAFGLWAMERRPAPPKKPTPPSLNGFALKEGDRVLFYGDSITEQRHYTTYIETYCATRFPNKRFTFFPVGWSGDKVWGGGGGDLDTRLTRDVLPYKPTVITICLGMNDGNYSPFDKATFDAYIEWYRRILDTLKKKLPKARITLMTPPAYDDVTRAPDFPGGYNKTLLTFGEAVKKLGQEYDLTVADTNAPLIAALEKAKESDPALAAQIIPDRIHPGSAGHLVMAAAVLKAWNAPDTVADITIDAAGNRLVKSKQSVIADLRATPEQVTFTQADAVLPWPLHRDAQKNRDVLLTLAVTDIENRLNRYQLKVTGLEKERYELRVDDTPVGVFTREQLAVGVNLAELPLHPANVQAAQVLELTRQRDDSFYRRWRVIIANHWKAKTGLEPKFQKRVEELTQEEIEIIARQRAATYPLPHHVELVAKAANRAK